MVSVITLQCFTLLGLKLFVIENNSSCKAFWEGSYYNYLLFYNYYYYYYMQRHMSSKYSESDFTPFNVFMFIHALYYSMQLQTQQRGSFLHFTFLNIELWHSTSFFLAINPCKFYSAVRFVSKIDYHIYLSRRQTLSEICKICNATSQPTIMIYLLYWVSLINLFAYANYLFRGPSSNICVSCLQTTFFNIFL